MRKHRDNLTITLSATDLQIIREELLFALQRVPGRAKGNNRWLDINRTYDNLIDAVVAAEEKDDA